MIKRFLLISLLLFILIGGTSCGEKKLKVYDKTGNKMGTFITEQVYSDNSKTAEKVMDEAMDRIGQIEDTMTINKEGSEIDKLNAAAGSNSVSLGADSIFVLETAKKYAELSNGAFDVTIGPLVKAWAITTKNPRIPGKDEINSLKSLVNFRDLTVNSSENWAKLARKGQIVDLGGIAKGYAGDEVIKVYKKYGIKSAYINLGGNVVVLGHKPDGSDWRIGIRNPRGENDEEIIGMIKVSDKAIVSSGDYERYFIRNGVRYHHILDSDTGYPADSGLIATTIIADSSIVADALSTSTFILGLDKGMKLIESLDGVEALFITKDKKIYVTSGLKDKFTFQDESKEFTYVQ